MAAEAVGQADDRAGGIAVPDGADVVQRADDADLAAVLEGVRRRAVVRILPGPCFTFQAISL